MLVDPDLYEIVKGHRGMFKGIDACIHAQCLVSAIALIYSSIDALSALTRPPATTRTDRNIFINWVNRYMQPNRTLHCSADDLYGARCGILHTYSTSSDFSRRGTAKHLIYKWQDGPDPDPNRAIPLPTAVLCLCVEDLRRVLEDAAINFLGSIEKNNELRERVDQHRQELLCYKPWNVVSIGAA